MAAGHAAHGGSMALTLESTNPITDRLTVARSAAAAAALFLLANGVVALMSDPATLSDHTRGAGAVSELTVGLAFLAGAVSLLALTPVSGWRRWLWMLPPFGLAVGGATMIGVPLFGAEPPAWLFVLAVVPIFVGMIAVGILGSSRVWPWWTGVSVALFLPIMFTVPFNGLFMMAVWLSVAMTARHPAGTNGSSRESA